MKEGSTSMNASDELLETLRQFHTKGFPGKTRQQSLLEYCQNILGGIERVHFDFKEKSDPTNAILGDSEKKNLSKAVSGFANSAGGVLIWGLQDETLQPKPIRDVADFVDRMLRLAHQVTSPVVPQIDGDFIPSDGPEGEGFAVIFVPESQLPPHRVILNVSEEKIQNHYYVRSGSSFTVAPHSQLEDMFGRRPRPILELTHSIVRGPSGGDWVKVYVKLTLENRGRGIARFPFLAVEVDPPYGVSLHGIDGNGRCGLPCLEFIGACHSEDDVVKGMQATGGRFGSQDGLVLHCGMKVDVTRLKATILRQNCESSSDLCFRFEVAAEGMPLQRGRLKIPGTQLVQAAGF